MPSRTEDVTLGHFCAKLRGDPRAGYLKQCPLGRSGLPLVAAGARAVFTRNDVVGPGDGVPVGRRRRRDDGTAQRRRGQRAARDARVQARAALPAESRSHLDPNPRYDNGTECCEIDAFLSEAEKARQYPPYAGCAPPLSFVLRAGDALFIPRDWFHAVRSLDVSVSVFYSTLADLATRGAHRALTDFAHNRLGLWRANCVCHRRRGTLSGRD